MQERLKADLMLLMITVFWGASYVLTKIGLEELEPFTLTALRFLIAFCICAAVFFRHFARVEMATVKYENRKKSSFECLPCINRDCPADIE